MVKFLYLDSLPPKNLKLAMFKLQNQRIKVENNDNSV